VTSFTGLSVSIDQNLPIADIAGQSGSERCLTLIVARQADLHVAFADHLGIPGMSSNRAYTGALLARLDAFDGWHERHYEDAADNSHD
jgi:hypothetical protein